VSENRLKLSAVITNQLLYQLSYAGNRNGWEYAILVALSPASQKERRKKN
jgi:hypothetical protein